MNIIVAGGVGLLCFIALLVWGVPGLDPSLWDEVSVVSGLRPPRSVFPGFWRVLTGWLFAVFGGSHAVGILRILGPLAASLCATLFYLFVRHLLELLLRTEKSHSIWRRKIAPYFSAVAALGFGLCDPLWRISSAFSPDELRFLLFMVIIYLGIRWLMAGSRWRLFPLMALMGLMAAETPLAFLLPVLLVSSYILVRNCIANGYLPSPDTLPSMKDLPKWRMFFLFLGGLALMVWINGTTFVALGGLEANGWNANDLYFRYGAGYWHVISGTATIIGWVLAFGFCVLPLVVAIKVFPLVARDDRAMPFNLGVILFFAGSLATLQCGAVKAVRFWTFTRDIVLVQSGFMLVVFVFCAAVTFALFGAGFALECHRFYLVGREGRPGPLLKGVAPVLAFAVLVLVLVHVPKPVESEMQRIVDDAVAEIVDECGDAKWLFTDGRLDPAIELLAATKGKDLHTLNMMSGASEWEISVRKRGFDPASEDYKSVETGVPALLRVWAGEKPNGMDKVALQLGFEFWRRERKPLPKTSGMVARETGLDDAAAKRGIERADALAKRILAVSPKIEKADPSPALASALSAVNWRLSRFARLRSDVELANKLDVSNSALKRMLSIIEYERLRTFMQLTPREGLQLALKRADFAEARRYSAAVLRYDEDDPEANFGIGMSALTLKDFKEAEFYLKRCLKRRPKEPAVLNNLSIICRKQKRYEEAVAYARQAIEVLPNSPEVKETLADALKKAP